MNLFDQYRIAPKLAVPEQYRVYALNGNTLSDLGRCIPAITKFPKTEEDFNYYIISGKLFYATGIQIGTSSGWTAISANLGICNGALYLLGGSSPYQIGTDTDWTYISGPYSYSIRPLCIRNGLLFSLATGASLVQIGTDSGWTTASGRMASTDTAYTSGLAIRNGLLYVVGFNHLTDSFGAVQIGTDSGWNKISGYISEYHVGFGIKNGALFSVSNSLSAAQVGTDIGWTDVSGSYTLQAGLSITSYGIKNGMLYGLNRTLSAQIGTESGWTKVVASNVYVPRGYGIRDGKLYEIQGTEPVQIGSSSGWIDVAGCWTGTGGHIAGSAIRKIA